MRVRETEKGIGILGICKALDLPLDLCKRRIVPRRIRSAALGQSLVCHVQ